MSLPNEIKPFDNQAHYDAYDQEVRGGLGHLLFGYARWLLDEQWTLNDRHLLTIESDDIPGFCWGDWGTLHFGVSVDDLKTGRFDRTLFKLQC